MTRVAVLAAATRLFATEGFVRTTMQAIASESGVAVETVYAQGSKTALLLACVDRALVGDDSDLPLIERPPFTNALGVGSQAATVEAFIRVGWWGWHRLRAGRDRGGRRHHGPRGAWHLQPLQRESSDRWPTARNTAETCLRLGHTSRRPVAHDVRSATHLRGRTTKPSASSLRLTIATVAPATFAQATILPAKEHGYAADPAIGESSRR
jgi:AcrR family transcriptional regulator